MQLLEAKLRACVCENASVDSTGSLPCLHLPVSGAMKVPASTAACHITGAKPLALRGRRSGARVTSSSSDCHETQSSCLCRAFPFHFLLELFYQELKKRDLHLCSGEKRGTWPPPGGRIGLR